MPRVKTHDESMLITRKLKLTTALLAMRRSNNPEAPRRVFTEFRPRPKDLDDSLKCIRTDMARWNWAFLEARDALQFENIATSAILPCRWFAVKNTSTYTKKTKLGKGRVKKEQFESLSAGQKFEMQFTLSKHIPPSTDGMGRFTEAPTEEQFDAMLEHIGSNLGISEWGHPFGYGMFVISEYDLNKNTNAEDQLRHGEGRGSHDDSPGDG